MLKFLQHLQQTSLTNYDHFYSLGAFFLALSYSMGRIFRNVHNCKLRVDKFRLNLYSLFHAAIEILETWIAVAATPAGL